MPLPVFVWFVLLTPVGCSVAWAHHGEEKNLKIGMSTALSGPSARLGRGVRQGYEAYFYHINKSGGVDGHPLELVVKDDGYEPEAAALNVRSLIREERVAAVAGIVGTPTAVVAAPVAVAQETLFFGAFTGTQVLREYPPNPYIVNVRASYAQEIEAIVSGIYAARISPRHVGFLIQDDAFGFGGYANAVAAFKRRGFGNELLFGKYARNTNHVESALAGLMRRPEPPRIVVMIAAPEAAARFITLARDVWRQTQYVGLSFTGAEVVLADLGAQAEGVLFSQVVPHYTGNADELVFYRRVLREFDPDAVPGFVSLEGFLSARILVAGLERSRDLSRASIVRGVNGLRDAGLGMVSGISRRGLGLTWPTQVKNGRLVPLSSWSEGFKNDG